MINNPSSILHACEILKNNGFNIKYVISLVNRGENLNELFLKQKIKFLSIYNYPTKNNAEIKESEEYLKLFK